MGTILGLGSKENSWALVTIIVYSFVAHMRMVPGLKGVFAFNLASLLGIGSVIMTYFGVNYYFSGLHSYAPGDPLPVPSSLYYTMLVIGVTATLAYYKHKQMGGEDGYPKISRSSS